MEPLCPLPRFEHASQCGAMEGASSNGDAFSLNGYSRVVLFFTPPHEIIGPELILFDIIYAKRDAPAEAF